MSNRWHPGMRGPDNDRLDKLASNVIVAAAFLVLVVLMLWGVIPR